MPVNHSGPSQTRGESREGGYSGFIRAPLLPNLLFDPSF